MSRAVLVGMVMCVLALAGCSALANLTELQLDLEAAGYQINAINHNPMIDDSTLGIDAVMPGNVPTEEDANRIAEIAWTTYPGEIDTLLIMINSQQMMYASTDDLTAQFGERPEDLVAKTSNSGTNVTAIVVVVVVALVFAGLMVLLWWRGRRPPPPVAPPAYPGGMPSVYQYPPQPPQNP